MIGIIDSIRIIVSIWEYNGKFLFCIFLKFKNSTCLFFNSKNNNLINNKEVILLYYKIIFYLEEIHASINKSYKS